MCHTALSFRRILTRRSSLQKETPSPLLCLPAELRNAIYHYVVGGYLIQPQEEDNGPGKARRIRHTGSQEWHSPSVLLSLTGICREIQVEASLLSFSLNRFEMTGPLQFIEFKAALSAQQRKAINTIVMDDGFFEQFDDLGCEVEDAGPEDVWMGEEMRLVFDDLKGLERAVVLVHILPPAFSDGGELKRAIKHDTDRARENGQMACTWLKAVLAGRNVEIVTEEMYIKYS